MRFICGYVHLEWQFDLYHSAGKFHYFLCKCGVVKRHIVAILSNDSEAIKWFQNHFDEDSKDIDNGII